MKIKKTGWIIAFGLLALSVSACGTSNATLTPPATRSATQTPWIIYVPVTTTPEPTHLPLLPTAEVKAAATRTSTRPVVVAKPTVVPTKPPVAPSAPVAQPSAAPACSIGTVTLTFPENGAPRNKGAAFEMKWTPPAALSGETETTVGYRIEMESRRGSKIVNGSTVYVSHNKYLRDGKFVYDRGAVTMLAAGDDAVVTWKVTIVKASGGFDEGQQNASGSIVNCGPSSLPSQIQLIGFGD
ncbi:MAG: hypothetical protein L0Y55_05475 [Anaerolineales bacterium]|nr:hypothetical protein [Anaerolineales bacterium]